MICGNCLSFLLETLKNKIIHQIYYIGTELNVFYYSTPLLHIGMQLYYMILIFIPL